MQDFLVLKDAENLNNNKVIQLYNRTCRDDAEIREYEAIILK